MTGRIGTFPFGEPIRRVIQSDRSPKRVFVLGVYASAVHARWCDARGRQLVRALGVAAEPCIFWRGDQRGAEAAKLIAAIDVPPGAGHLEPAERRFNGPSGRSIDQDYLDPLGLTRADAWLCDLVPHSCMNDGQAKAVSTRYTRLLEEYALPPVNWPAVPRKLSNAGRRQAIAGELRESAAVVVITLGDQPLRWFGAAFGSEAALEAYGRNPEAYGRLHDFEIEGRHLKLLPLVHPRQAAGLSGHNKQWKDLHKAWARTTAPVISSQIG